MNRVEQAPRRRSLRALFVEELGLSGAQTALLAVLGLGLLIIVIRIIMSGSLTAADNAKQELEQHSPPISWGSSDGTVPGTIPGSPAAKAGDPGKADAPSGGGDDDDGGFLGAVGDFFGQVGGFGKGFVLQAWDDAKGLGSLAVTGWHLSPLGMLADPQGTWNEATKWVKLGQLAWEHPDQVWQAVTKPFTDPWNRGDYGEAIGRGTFEVVLAIALGAATDGTGDAALVLEESEEALVALERAEQGLNTVEKGLSAEEKAAQVLEKQQELLTQLEKEGVKFDPSKILKIDRAKDGKIVFLEEGVTDAEAAALGRKNGAGLKHILEDHEADFANKGIKADEIPDVVMKARSEGEPVGFQGKGEGRPIYKTEHNGKPLCIAITTGSNGFIVGANPASCP